MFAVRGERLVLTMIINRRFVSLALFLLCLREGSALSTTTQNADCAQQMYRGIDSRLKVAVVGALPDPRHQAIGFEVVNGWPVIATARSIFIFTNQQIISKSFSTLLEGMSAPGKSDLVIQTRGNIENVSGPKAVVEPFLSKEVKGHLYNSGNHSWLEVRSRANVNQFVARKQDGSGFLIATIRGTFRAAYWGEDGLAAVVGESLFVWRTGSRQFVRVLSDRGLVSTRDLTFVGPDKVVLTLKSSVVLVSSDSLTIVAVMRSARCRFARGILYLADAQQGFVWALQGVEALGSRTTDLAYAHSLLSSAPPIGTSASPQFREAVRLVGCAKAEELLRTVRGHR
jgi:hypothetical protein